MLLGMALPGNTPPSNGDPLFGDAPSGPLFAPAAPTEPPAMSDARNADSVLFKLDQLAPASTEEPDSTDMLAKVGGAPAKLGAPAQGGSGLIDLKAMMQQQQAAPAEDQPTNAAAPSAPQPELPRLATLTLPQQAPQQETTGQTRGSRLPLIIFAVLTVAAIAAAAIAVVVTG